MLVVGVVSVPEFLVATLAVLIFAVLAALAAGAVLRRTTSTRSADAAPHLRHAGDHADASSISAQMVRMTRAALIDTLSTSYVEMALLKGARAARMVLRHALPNAIGPIVNAVALSLSYLLGGVIIVETIFNYPGIAKLMVDAVATRDLPLMQTCAMIFCAGYLLLVPIADIVAILVQPEAAHDR